MSKKINKYFAAANSYNGFVSLFKDVFLSKDFDRIYVLKGGPGTGKSSFMKKMAKMLDDKKCEIEKIYCSSDPHSLDGIIVGNVNKKIAILDGTAPHERDAVIPGAIDEIINLGDSWDSAWLSAKKDKILEITKEKSNAYETGYSYLRMAGIADAFVYNNYKLIFDKNRAKIKAEEILDNISPLSKQKISSRYISSFGRYGNYPISLDDYSISHVIKISGEEYSSKLFMNTIYECAYNNQLSFINFLSPFNSINSEGLFFEKQDFAIVRSEFGEFNSDIFINNDKLLLERTKSAKEIKRLSTKEAERWFSIASELHYELEKIYGEAMNYEKNNIIFDKKLQEIVNILEL